LHSGTQQDEGIIENKRELGTELLLKLTNQGLTSLVLELFGPGYPSVPPFLEWVYEKELLTEYFAHQRITPIESTD